jgi:hypothetical protein
MAIVLPSLASVFLPRPMHSLGLLVTLLLALGVVL